MEDVLDPVEEDEIEEDEVDSPTSLTDWKNPPKVSDLEQDYRDAQSDHAVQVTKVEGWLNNLNVTGPAKITKVKGRSSVVPKLIRKQAEWRYASLSEPFLSTEDVFNVDPVSAEDKKGAQQNQLVLNNQFNTKINKVDFVDEYIRTAVDEGTVIVRVGWKYREEEVIEEVPKFSFQPTNDPETIKLLQEVHSVATTDQQAFTNLPQELQQAYTISVQQRQLVAPIPDGTEQVTRTRVTANHPTVDICNYKDVILDPTCMGDMSKANFIIYSFETSLSELEEEGTYSNLDQIKPVDNSPLSDPDYGNSDQTNFSFKDKPRQKLIAREYWGSWDIHNTGIVKAFVATYVGSVMIRLEENPYPDQEIPFVKAQYLPVRKSSYGEPDGELLEDNQKIIGAVTRGMLDVMGRGANGQVGSRKDALDIINRRRFSKGEDYEFNISVDPKQAFHMHTYSEIPQSASIMLQIQNADAESLTGVKAFHSGISGQALGDTATGIRSALDATSKRELGILRRLAEGIKQIGRKFISMNAEFLSDEEVIRVTNEEFVTVRRDDLAGFYDLKLSISTAEADDHKAQELSFMLQTTGNSMDPELSRIIQADIARLRKMPGLAKRLEEFQPTPDPIAQRAAELEIMLLEAQVATEQAKAQEHAANALLDQAKAATEQAKIRHLNSDADLKDLKFVEDESGTTQERKLQQAGEQARSNMDLKVLEKKLDNEQPDVPQQTAGVSQV